MALFLAAAVTTTTALAIAAVVDAARRSRLRRLARSWQMRYVRSDLFDLARRVAGQFAVPGAADLRVVDVIYASRGERHRYLFTVEYTTQDRGQRRREARAATFCEPRERTGPGPSPLVLGPDRLPLLKQYEELYRTQCAEEPQQPRPPG